MIKKMVVFVVVLLGACGVEGDIATPMTPAVTVSGPEVGVEPALYEVTLRLDGDQLARMAGLFAQIYPRYYVASGWDDEWNTPVWVPAIDYSELEDHLTNFTLVQVSNTLMPRWCELWNDAR